jgi:hypothetical protein
MPTANTRFLIIDFADTEREITEITVKINDLGSGIFAIIREINDWRDFDRPFPKG